MTTPSGHHHHCAWIHIDGPCDCGAQERSKQAKRDRVAAGSDLRAEFVAKIAQRIERGAEEYGDQSFHESVPQTTEEILDEVLDVAGWAFVLWVQMRMKLERLELAASKMEGS